MFHTNQSSTNSINQVYYIGLTEVVLLAVITTGACCVFIFINCTMLFTLRSEVVFCETPRYVLLFNLLFADTELLVQAQSMYMLSACRIRLTYLVCFSVSMISQLNTLISPLTLVVMSLERYVAVCYPLRHATIVTVRNTEVAVALTWAFSFLNVFVQVILLLKESFSDQLTQETTDYCGKEKVFLNPVFDLFEKCYTYFLFVLAGVVVISTYIGVMIAACSASTDKVSAQKAHKTLLLHLVQLVLSLCSSVQSQIFSSLAEHPNRIMVVRIQISVYIGIIIFPRCLSSLIYGLRDQTIRPVLLQNLFCRWRSPPPFPGVSTNLSVSFH